MDKIRTVIDQSTDIINTHQVGDKLPPDFLYVILGPTASGKTALAVELAKSLDGEIISVDSRQVYRGMDIGTGKDLHAYKSIPHHLIDIRNPGQRYDIAQFQADFENAYIDITSRGHRPIAVGGTGMYIHSLLISQPYIHAPIDQHLRNSLQDLDKATLISRIGSYAIPKDFKIDHSSHKRLIRAIEILEQLKAGYQIRQEHRGYRPLIIGLNPPLEFRRQNISERLQSRLQEGLLEEVERLLTEGLTHGDLQYYGLEYKYSSLYLLGQLSKERFVEKLETEIHRYAKRQMTFFRKMEKDGLTIQWLHSDSTAERLDEILTLRDRIGN